jgi:CRP/FNR family transcriptional regulator
VAGITAVLDVDQVMGSGMQDYSVHVQCGDCPIRHRAVCARCETDELARLEQIKYYRSFQAGQTIIWSGDRMEFVGSVVTGIATLTQTMEDGRRQMVGLLLPSDFVGRPGRPTAAYDVTATTDLVMCCFRKKPFEEMMAATPHIAQRLLEMTLDELDAAREWMLLLGRKTAREKIASLISIIARRDAALHLRRITGVLAVDLPLTREEMADYLGLTLETVSRQISALKKDGVISLTGNRHVSIPDLDRLLEEAGDDSDGGMLV